jgi:hypothetical protein
MKSRLRCITLRLGILFSEKLALAQGDVKQLLGRFFEALRGLEIRRQERQVTNRYTDFSVKDFKPGQAQGSLDNFMKSVSIGKMK